MITAVLILVLIVPIVLLVLLRRHANRFQDSAAGRWVLITLMGWGFLWVFERVISKNWSEVMSANVRLILFFITILLCGLLYGWIYWHIGRTGKMRAINQKLDEIGQEE